MIWNNQDTSESIPFTCMVWSHFCHVWLYAIPWTTAHQVPLSMGFSRQEYWSGLPFPPPGDLTDPGVKPRSPVLQEDSLLSEPPEKPISFTFTNFISKENVCAQWLQLCPTLCDPIHGILQARIQEWVAVPFSMGSSQPRSPILQVNSLLSEPPGKRVNSLTDNRLFCLTE